MNGKPKIRPKLRRRLTVVTLYPSNYRDPAPTLRVIADEIDAGRYGDVGCVGVALLGNTLEVFGAGRDSDGTSTGMVLLAGAMRLLNPIVYHGR